MTPSRDAMGSRYEGQVAAHAPSPDMRGVANFLEFAART